MKRKSRIALWSLLASASAWRTGVATAQTTDWTVSSGNWSNPSNWDNGVPAAGYFANISLNSSGLSQTITYDYTGAGVTLNELALTTAGGNSPGTAAEILTMSGNTLVATTENVGMGEPMFGFGTIDQSGGMNSVGSGGLVLGYNLTDTGDFNLSGAGSLSVSGCEYDGFNGAGTINQSGGTNTVNGAALYLGYYSGSTGIYTLTGGTTTVNGNVDVGGLSSSSAATGTLTVSNTGQMTLNGASGASKTQFALYNGAVSAINEFIGGRPGPVPNGSIVVGPSGVVGNFTQTGGADSVSLLTAGYFTGDQGSFNLSGGSLANSGGEYLGVYGAGTFTQTGGTNTISGGNSLILGYQNRSSGTYALSAGSLSISGGAYVGGSSAGVGGAGTLTITNTGQMTVTGTLQVWNHGDVNAGGLISTVGGLSIATGGLVNVNSALLITSDGGSASMAETSIQQDIAGGAIKSPYAVSNGLAIAYADGSDGVVANLPAGEIIIEPALSGDTDLNGTVNIHDLQNLLGEFNDAGFWDQGNFNGDPTVDINDLQLLLSNFNQSSTLSYTVSSMIDGLVAEFGFTANANTDGGGFTLVPVPEPGSIFLLGVGFGLILRRRR
jgi:PEP-CTERM motif